MSIFPVYQSTTVTDFGADATSHLANMPATVNAGELLLAFAAFDMTATITTPSGWSLLVDFGQSLSEVFSLYGKVAAGTEGGGTTDFVTSTAQRGSVHVIRVSSWAGHLGGLMIAQGVINSTTPYAGMTWGATARDTLWIASAAKSSATVWGTGPTGYSNTNATNASEDSTASASIVTATRTNSAAGELTSTFWGVTAPSMLIGVLPVGALKSTRPTAQIGV
jgi:hypothetical protein